MDIQQINLPAEVLAALAPAVPLVQAEARAGTVAVEHYRIKRTGDAQVRANGPEYRAGYDTIIATVFPARVPVVPGPVSTPVERDPEDDPDEDEDDPVCDYACEVCGCCGECNDGRHGDADTSNAYLYSNRRGETYCGECEHLCD